MPTNVNAYKKHLCDLFDSVIVRETRKGDVKYYADKCIENRAKYEASGAPLGVPWYVVAIIDALENTFGNGWLANGDPLTGPTVRAPIGLGRGENFPISWARGAELSMKKDALDKVTDWTLGNLLYRVMLYNGTGYLSKGIETPYLWSFCTHYVKGKYVKDGPEGWDANAVSNQCGAAVILWEMERRGVIAIPRSPGATPARTAESVGWHKLQLIVNNVPESLPAGFPKIEIGFLAKLAGTNEDYRRARVELPAEFVRAWFSQFPNAHDIRFEGEQNKWPGDLAEGETPPAPEIPLPMQSGATGTGVSRLQAEINRAMGSGIAVDGDFGPETLASVRAVQARLGLPATGVVELPTWDGLRKLPTAEATGFSRVKLASIMEREALAGNTWNGNGRAKKYTKKFEGVFGTGRFAWCAACVAWCVEQSGARMPVNAPGTGYTFALVEAWQQWAIARGFWHDGTAGISRGDIVLFDWQGATFPDGDWEDHIGVAMGGESGGFVVCGEGNVSDSTATKTRAKSLIQGYVRLPDGFAGA
jgi:lysozyme family protein